MRRSYDAVCMCKWHQLTCTAPPLALSLSSSLLNTKCSLPTNQQPSFPHKRGFKLSSPQPRILKLSGIIIWNMACKCLSHGIELKIGLRHDGKNTLVMNIWETISFQCRKQKPTLPSLSTRGYSVHDTREPPKVIPPNSFAVHSLPCT